MRALYRGLGIAIAALCLAGSLRAACPPDGQTKAGLQDLKAAQWRRPVGEPDAARQSLALGLLDCLADPDPVLRDELAFEALSAWMRGNALTLPTLQAIRTRLSAILDGPADEAGFRQPFAALALAEVARRSPIAVPVDRRACGAGQFRSALPGCGCATSVATT